MFTSDVICWSVFRAKILESDIEIAVHKRSSKCVLISHRIAETQQDLINATNKCHNLKKKNPIQMVALICRAKDLHIFTCAELDC